MLIVCMYVYNAGTIELPRSISWLVGWERQCGIVLYLSLRRLCVKQLVSGCVFVC